MSLTYVNIPIRRGSYAGSVDYITAFQCDMAFSFINSATTGLGWEKLKTEMPFDEPIGATNLLQDMASHPQEFNATIPPTYSQGRQSCIYWSKNAQAYFQVLVEPAIYSVLGGDVGCEVYAYPRRENANQGITESLGFANRDWNTARMYLGISSDGMLFTIGYGKQLTTSALNVTTFNKYLDNEDYARYCMRYYTDVNKIKASYVFNDIVISERYPTTDENTGTFNPDNDSDVISTPLVPSINASVFTHVYKMTPALLSNFKSELFSDNFWDAIKKWFTKPMDSIVALNIVPLALNDVTNLQPIQVGTRDMSAQGYLASGTVFPVDCGYVDINEYYGNFADYESTIIQVYLPYVGFIPIKTVDVMGGRLKLDYLVNIVTGDFVAFLRIIRNKFDINLNAVLYETSGNMFAQIPVTSADYSNVIQGVLNTITSTATTISSAVTGNVAGMVAGGTGIAQGITQMVSAPAIQRSGSFNKNASICTMRKPFVLLERPRIALPSTLQSEKGFIANFSAKLSSLTGYTEVKDCTVENITNATKEEKDLIMSALKNGIYL